MKCVRDGLTTSHFLWFTHSLLLCVCVHVFFWSNTVKYIEKKGSSSRTGGNKYSERDSHFWADWFIPITPADQGLSKHTDVVCSTIFGRRETVIRLHCCTRAGVASKAECNPTTLAFYHQEIIFLGEQTTTTFGKKFTEIISSLSSTV